MLISVSGAVTGYMRPHYFSRMSLSYLFSWYVIPPAFLFGSQFYMEVPVWLGCLIVAVHLIESFFFYGKLTETLKRKLSFLTGLPSV
jgi:cellulose synthase/poly-beta-1,6-N-acetylglucosamine synthase-like glycosyltransferase